MLRTYFKTAFRSLFRHKSYFFINVAGLAVGIAVCMMIFLVIRFETSFDSFHAKKDRTVRVLTTFGGAEASTVSYSRDVPFPLPQGLALAFPQMEIAPVFASHNDQMLIPGEDGKTLNTFKEDRGVFFTSPSFFEIFNFPLLAGNYQSLKDPNNVLLSKEIAEKYFGDWQTALGKTIKLEAGGSLFSHSVDVLKVTGILAPIPQNTDLQLKLVVAFGTGITEDMAANKDWSDRTNADYGCYVLLPEQMSVDNFNKQLAGYAKKLGGIETNESFVAQALTQVHFDVKAAGYSNKSISKQMLNGLFLIAGFILLIACVNFINLSTAQAVNRSREVGVRKVLGGNRLQLRMQFLIETLLIVFMAVLLAIVVTVLALPTMNRLLDLSLSANDLQNPGMVLFLCLMTLAVTALAGFYPAVVLSGYNPITALQRKISAGNASGFSLRKTLVVFQFAVAQALIIGTFITVKQMDHFTSQPLGFEKDAIVNVPFRVDSLRLSRLDYLKSKLMSVNGIQAVSFSSNTPVENGNDIWNSFRFDHADQETDFKAITKFADEKYLDTYKFQLVAGRNLQPSPMTREFLINETLMKSLGITDPNDILNKEISIWGDKIKCPVVGVLRDFNDRSFKHEIAPLLVTTNVTMYSQAGIKLETRNIATTLGQVKEIFEQTFPNFVYEFGFLDEKIAGFYKQESQLTELYKIFSLIAIFLSCLGLYGLVSFVVVQKTKEVGVRKVLGATTADIVLIFSKEFLVLITIAFIIASPVAWFYMNRWLQDYVYRINVSWWLFAAAGVSAIVIALATISFQAIKAANANPVKSLRTE